jgi:hypothetical protein
MRETMDVECPRKAIAMSFTIHIVMCNLRLYPSNKCVAQVKEEVTMKFMFDFPQIV